MILRFLTPLFLFFSIFIEATSFSIPPEDKEEIKKLFEFLFKTQPFFYTLFFDKPISFSHCLVNGYTFSSVPKKLRLDEYIELTLQLGIPSRTTLKRWQIWEKYQSNFKNKNFLFLRKKLSNMDTVILINKEAFCKSVNDHLPIFRRLISPSISANDLLDKIENGNEDLYDILNCHEALLGILLGFGQYNSILFEERELVEQKLQFYRSIQSRSMIDKLEKELQALWNTLQIVSEFHIFHLANFIDVAFVADLEHDETKALKEKYLKQQQKISAVYLNKDWFEKILLQLSN